MQNNGRVLLVRTFVFGSLLHNRKLSITFGVQQKGVAHEMLLSQIHSDPLECFHSAYIQPSSKSRKVHIFSFQMYNKILESFFNSSADGYYFQYCVIITMTQNSSRCGSLFSVAILLSMCYCFDLLRLLRKPRRFPCRLVLRATRWANGFRSGYIASSASKRVVPRLNKEQPRFRSKWVWSVGRRWL